MRSSTDLKKKPLVLLETEGSYPYSGGGVSTWSHDLCKELNGKIDYIIFTLTGSPNTTLHYELPDNVKKIVQIPLWGTEDPVSYYDSKRPYSSHINKKNHTTTDNIEQLFLPIFKDFIEGILDPINSVKKSPQVIYGMWKYFQHFDYKRTMTHALLWEYFRDRVYDHYIELYHHSNSDIPHLIDVTFGMRWFYHFLMPVAANIPRVDLTHSTLAGFPSIPSIVLKYEYGTPSLITDHGVFIRERHINISSSDFPFFSKKLLLDFSTMITTSVYESADQILPVSTFNKTWEVLFGGEDEKIKVINNGIDPSFFIPKPKPARTRNIPTVVAVNHIFALKDIETMIRSCSIVRETIPDVQFKVYGSLTVDKEYVKKCRKLIKELDVEANFDLAGFHPNPQQIYNEGDLYLLTSISESLPYTIMEAMSCARPVVATDVGGVSEIVGENGILCQPRNPQEIANAVIKLLKDDDLRIRMGRASRDQITLKFTKNKSINSYLETYLEHFSKPHKALKNEIDLPSVQTLLQYLSD